MLQEADATEFSFPTALVGKTCRHPPAGPLRLRPWRRATSATNTTTGQTSATARPRDGTTTPPRAICAPPYATHWPKTTPRWRPGRAPTPRAIVRTPPRTAATPAPTDAPPPRTANGAATSASRQHPEHDERRRKRPIPDALDGLGLTLCPRHA